MKAASWILFILGTLLATAAGAHDPPMWGPFGGGIAMAVVGAMVLRRELARATGGGEDDDSISDLPGLKTALTDLTGHIAGLAALPQGQPDLREKLEGVLLDRLLPVVEARTFLQNAHGVEAYARVFTPLASGERCLNRAWSALADGNPAEAHIQLGRARGHMEVALKGWPT